MSNLLRNEHWNLYFINSYEFGNASLLQAQRSLTVQYTLEICLSLLVTIVHYSLETNLNWTVKLLVHYTFENAWHINLPPYIHLTLRVTVSYSILIGYRRLHTREIENFIIVKNSIKLVLYSDYDVYRLRLFPSNKRWVVLTVLQIIYFDWAILETWYKLRWYLNSKLLVFIYIYIRRDSYLNKRQSLRTNTKLRTWHNSVWISYFIFLSFSLYSAYL
jgi:hypothetical protein